MNRIPAHAAGLAAFLLIVAAGCTRAPFPLRTPAPTPAAESADTAAAEPRRAPGVRPPRPYRQVVPEDAISRTGVFHTHLVDEKLFFEIPTDALNRDFLLIARTAAGTPTQGAPRDRIVRWERRNQRIFLTERDFQMRADSLLPIHEAVAARTHGALVASFEIESFGPDSAAVIDVTPLFTDNRPTFTVVRGIVTDRSFIDHAAAFPRNVNVTATQTGVAPPFNAPSGAPPVASTVRTDWSFLLLPEEPMMPRLEDSRVGYLSIEYTDFSDGTHRAETRRYIRRFRLEQADPAAEVSDAVEPIVFWIDRATPDWLVPWVRRGVEEWRPAFEEAGFRDAILARRAPARDEDPDWSPHDARHSMIYWRASTIENATGTQTVDPRSGEILKAEVNMFHNIMNLLRNWYFVQVAPLDARARAFPLPDTLMGRLVQYVVAHEVGHAIGFPHNWKASYTYPADSIRSADFLRRMGGHVPTVMDYSRFNYVAQPEDDVPVELLIPSVGPYDRFAVMWGHKPIPGARSPVDELPVLDRWARMQDTIPWLRFMTPGAVNDPGSVTEAVGNADAVRSNALGLRNLERVAGLLIPVAERPGEDYSLLNDLYAETVIQWGRYMGHVAAVVGGADAQERRGTGVRFVPVDRGRQREAVEFLIRNAFRPPAFLLDPEILRRIEPEGSVDRIARAQAQVVDMLLAAHRLNRLVEYETLPPTPGDAYTVAELAADLRRGIWSELRAPRVRIDVYRRNLQRAHVRAMGRIAGDQASTSDARPILRGELVEIERAVAAAVGRAADPVTRLHLEDLRLRIRQILDPPR